MTEVKEKKVEDIKKEADEIKCPVNRALYYVKEFLSGPMCGRCFPCSMGTYETKLRLENIVEGRGTEADLFALRRISTDMLEMSMCKKGKDTAKFISDWMDLVEADGSNVYMEHISGRCPSMECKAFIEYRLVPEKCIMCGLCQEACRYNAILGQKKTPFSSGFKPFEIRQRRCVKCGDCLKVCPTEAVIIIGVGEEMPVQAGK